MKKITRVILMLCVLLTVTGCNGNSDETSETTAETVHVSTEKTSDAETTSVQTEQTAENIAEETAAEAVQTEAESKILKLDRKNLYEYEWSEEYGAALAEFDCSTVNLGNEDAERYPELAIALSEASDYYEFNMLEEYNMLIESAKDSLSSGAEGFDTLVSTLDVHVRRADNVVISVLYDSYYYNGMNDGSRSFWGGNYDTETGEEIYLPDVLTDIDEFSNAVETELFNTVGADVFHSDNIIKEYFEIRLFICFNIN